MDIKKITMLIYLLLMIASTNIIGAKANKDYRRVVQTLGNMQLVFMCLIDGEDIKMESHRPTQFFQVVEGSTLINTLTREGRESYALRKGDCLIVPSHVKHEVINTGGGVLRLITIYSPPEHPAELFQTRQGD